MSFGIRDLIRTSAWQALLVDALHGAGGRLVVDAMGFPDQASLGQFFKRNEGLRGGHVAVVVDVAAPAGPRLLLGGERVKARRSGEFRAGPDDDGAGMLYGLVEFLYVVHWNKF